MKKLTAEEYNLIKYTLKHEHALRISDIQEFYAEELAEEDMRYAERLRELEVRWKKQEEEEKE